jgi:hypothetical protein
MVVGFTTTCAVSAYHHQNGEFESRSWRGVLDTTLYNKVLSVTCSRSVVYLVLTYSIHVLRFSSTNKTDRHDITKILLKVALNAITLTLTFY